MRVLILLNCAIEGLGLYEQYLSTTGIAYDLVRAYEEQPPALDQYDSIIVGGTPDPVYRRAEYGYLNSVYDLLVRAVQSNKPCLGVCGGAQLLAAAMGATVRPGEVKEIGIYELMLTSDGRTDSLLHGFPDRFESFLWHGDTFEIPRGGTLLVEGQKCSNQMFRCGNVAGVQFHLEISWEEAVGWAETYCDELAALGKTIDVLRREFEGREVKMRELALLLMSNYVASIST